jgi:hypothetical protein
VCVACKTSKEFVAAPAQSCLLYIVIFQASDWCWRFSAPDWCKRKHLLREELLISSFLFLSILISGSSSTGRAPSPNSPSSMSPAQRTSQIRAPSQLCSRVFLINVHHKLMQNLYVDQTHRNLFYVLIMKWKTAHRHRFQPHPGYWTSFCSNSWNSL